MVSLIGLTMDDLLNRDYTFAEASKAYICSEVKGQKPRSIEAIVSS